MNKALIVSSAALGLPLAIAATLVIGLFYVNEQQTLRMLANEPQEYVVGDAAFRANATGQLPDTGFGAAVPIEADPAAYLVFYDASGTPLAGTGVFEGAPPVLPHGVFAVAKEKGVDRFTWQPAKGVREAVVLRPAGPGYVMSGRSLAYIEWLEQKLTLRTIIGWIVTMLAIAAVSVFYAYRKRRAA